MEKYLLIFPYILHTDNPNKLFNLPNINSFSFLILTIIVNQTHSPNLISHTHTPIFPNILNILLILFQILMNFRNMIISNKMNFLLNIVNWRVEIEIIHDRDK